MANLQIGRGDTRKLRNIRCKLTSLLIKGSDRALNGVDLPLLEVRLATLATDPGWHGIECQMVSVAGRHERALWCASLLLYSECIS